MCLIVAPLLHDVLQTGTRASDSETFFHNVKVVDVVVDFFLVRFEAWLPLC